MGTPKFAVPSLKILLENGYEISAVVTVPDKKKGRGQNISESDVKEFAMQNKLNILQPDDLNSEIFICEVKSLNPDLFVIAAFRILPKEILSIPKFGSINLHASLLPKFRGAAPINRALIKGEKETGVTTFFLKEKVDTGNIIIQEKINIEDQDNAGTIHDKLSVLGAEVVLKTVRLIENGNITVTVQDESCASAAPKIYKKDCLINWNQESAKIHNFIRGLSPYPTAFSYLENKMVKVYMTMLTDKKSVDYPGKLLVENRKLFAATKDCNLEILELQTEGKNRIKAADFINGIDIKRELIFSDTKVNNLFR